ncbi:sex determination protein fruitless isoform X3 [Culicoides brevitarsis]|uniref:sex determination protein fruitless isoform X3 n=1 Tax=Culicoides brevitarsis TaxID=469753 RepID=UPI00307B504B
MDQQFCLRWNNHPSNLTGCLSRLLKNEALCDVTLVCNDKKFQAHQTILSACSPYLEEIFLNNKIPHPIVYMIGVGAVEMAALLDFMYQGEVNVAHSLLQKFLNTARILQVRGLTENDSMNFKAEDNDIENNNINNNNSTPKFSTQSVPPSSYDSDREITDKEIKEESEQSQQQHHREHRDSREHRSGDRDRDEEREQRLVSRRSASDRSNRESSTTPVDREQQSSSASLSSYPNKKARTSSVCDTPNMPFGSTQERRSDSGLVCLRFPPSLGSQKHSPTSKMDASDLDDGRRISPASNASRDHMPLKSDLDLNMPGLHHDIPPQLLPPNLSMHDDIHGMLGMQPSISEPPSDDIHHPMDHPEGPDGERSLMQHHALMASRGHHVLNLGNNDLDLNGQSNGSTASTRRDHNIDYSALFVQLTGTFPTLYRCVSCHKTVSNRWHHANIHRPQSHECPICGQKFTRRDNMKAHCKVKHADLKDRYYGHYVHM